MLRHAADVNECVLHTQGGRLLPRTLVDPAVLETLEAADERVLDLDMCISKTPAMLLADYTAVVLDGGKNTSTST